MSEKEILLRSLGLRNNAHRVKLVMPNGATNPVLGTSDPEEQSRRADIVKHWDSAREAPRAQTLVGIEQPLLQRTQTILYYQLPTAQRQALRGCFGSPGKSRKYQTDTSSVILLPPK